MSCGCQIHHQHRQHHHHHQRPQQTHPHHPETSTIIRNPKSNFVLDASEFYVQSKPFTGSSAQLWTLECIAHGRFIIKNKGNGKVLDVEGGAKPQNKIITFDRHGGENQQWHVNADGTLESPAPGNLVLDIWQEKYDPPNNIVAHPKHGGANQVFRLDYQ